MWVKTTTSPCFGGRRDLVRVEGYAVICADTSTKYYDPGTCVRNPSDFLNIWVKTTASPCFGGRRDSARVGGMQLYKNTMITIPSPSHMNLNWGV